MTEAPAFPLAKGSCPYDPSPEYARLREQGPITEVTLPGGGSAWLVTGHAEARALFASQRLSPDPTEPAFPKMRPPGNAPALPLEVRRAGRSFNQLDGAEHAAHRKLVIPSFTVRRMRALAPRLRAVADELIDGMIAQGPGADLVTGLAMPFPAKMFAVLFDVPEERREYFESRAYTAVTHREQAGAALTEVRELFGELLTERAERPGDDLLSEMAAGASRYGLSHERLMNTAMVLLVAGNESTLSMILHGAHALLSHPEQADVLRAAPVGAAENAVEELLRFLSVADTVPRAVLRDVEVGGHLIRAGEAVLLATPAQNRDPAAFPDPDVLDVRRPARHHVAFGYGVHQCIGQNLERVALEVVFSRLFERLPAVRLADDEPLTVDGGVGVQRISRLVVAW